MSCPCGNPNKLYATGFGGWTGFKCDLCGYVQGCWLYLAASWEMDYHIARWFCWNEVGQWLELVADPPTVWRLTMDGLIDPEDADRKQP